MDQMLVCCDEHFISFRIDVFPDDGLIQQSDLRLVMKACMEENGMKFDEKEIEDLVSRTESCLT